MQMEHLGLSRALALAFFGRASLSRAGRVFSLLRSNIKQMESNLLFQETERNPLMRLPFRETKRIKRAAIRSYEKKRSHASLIKPMITKRNTEESVVS